MAHPTSYATFTAAVAALSITGVRRTYTEPPRIINLTDMPCQFPRLPQGEHTPITSGSGGGWPALRCELVILTDSILTENQEVSWDDTITLMDAAATALRSASLASGPVVWTLRPEIMQHQGTYYHAIIADIRSTG